MTQTFQERNAQILRDFEGIRAQRQPLAAKIATREEESEREKNLTVLERARQYTTDTIVLSLAELQLEFGSIVSNVLTRLNSETEKLDDLQRAITTETDRLSTLHKTRIVADALYLLTQEHQERLRQLELQYSQNHETLEREQQETRQRWEREAAEQAAAQEQQQALLQQTRATQEADYTYETDRAQRLALDTYETTARQQEQALSDRRQTLERNWAEREEQLTRQATQLTQYRQRIDAFPQELETAIREAREASIRETTQDNRVKADLIAKDYETAQQGYSLQIQALEAKIAQQTQQIDSLSQQLTQALQQAQALTLRAFEPTQRPTP